MAELIHILRDHLGDLYEVERELGQGGMATVFLARDLKHERQVAIKVLKPELATVIGADRFLAEIKTTANLQHPHILALHDSGAAEGLLYFVMPYVAGESLQDRLAREKQLPVDDAVRIASEVAEALEYAHEQDIIHRDIKPANILLHAGRVLVADFGIALAVSAAGGTRLTETGLSVGTPQYMSPEQASGDRPLDGRSDVYSLGCVLYEMLAGEPPHTGSTAQAILARVLTEEPRPLIEQRAAVPEHVEATVHATLEKLPADRPSGAAAVRMALADPSATPGLGIVTRRSERSSLVTRAAVLVAVLTTALAGWALMLARGQGAQEGTRRFDLVFPDSITIPFIGESAAAAGNLAFAIAPDGRNLVFVAEYRESTRLMVRDLTSSEVYSLQGTEGAFHPFFSPDGAWVGYFSGTELRIVPLTGGASTPIGTIDGLIDGGLWLETDEILVSTDHCALWSFPAAGGPGTPTSLNSACPAQMTAVSDEGWILGSTYHGLSATELSSFEEWSVTSRGNFPVTEGWDSPSMADHPAVIPGGNLVYVSRSGTLMGVPFDERTREIAGVAVPLVPNLRREAASFAGQYSLSDAGTLVYASGSNGLSGSLVWVDGNGGIDSLSLAAAPFSVMSLSPDDSRLVAGVERDEGLPQVWLYDLANGSRQIIASPSDGILTTAAWEPAGSWFTFTKHNPAPFAFVTERVTLIPSQRRDTLPTTGGVQSISPDGATIIERRGWGAGGVWGVPVGGGDAVRLLDEGNFATVSPDGSQLAYTAQDVEGTAVFVRALGGSAAPLRVSPPGGEEAIWSPNNRQLFYRIGRQFRIVDYAIEDGVFVPGDERLFAEGPYINLSGYSYAVSRDGERLLLVRGPEEETTNRLHVVTNWFDEVERLVNDGNR